MNETWLRIRICRSVRDIDKARTQVEDANVRSRLAYMIAQRFGVTEQAKLRSAIRRYVRVSVLACLRRNVDDVAKVSFRHVRQSRAHQLHYAAQVRLHHFVPAIFGHPIDGLWNGEPGIVD